MPALARLIDHPDNPIPPGARVGTIAAADGRMLRWATFAPLASPCRGTVLILQGRAEFIERWFETVRDLQVRGFAVAAFDWRGQGGSERLTGNRRKGHVADFRAYGLDLDVILREVVADLPKPLALLGHSTGCLIALDAASRLAGRIGRVVMVAPFLGLGDFGLSESLARGLARLLRGIGLGRGFVPGGGETSMLTTPFAANRLTSDPARHARGAALASAAPEVVIGSPSVAWLNAAFAAMDRVFRLDALARWRLPTLVFACGNDAVVSNDAIERFVVATRTTALITIPGARHELLQERDRYREQFWAAFDAFVPGGDATRPTLPIRTAAIAAPPTSEGAPSVAVRQDPQHGVVQPSIAGGDHAPAVDGAAAGPRGDDAAGPLDDRDQRDDVVGLEPGLDHHVDEAAGDHAIGVAVDPVAREPHP